MTTEPTTGTPEPETASAPRVRTSTIIWGLVLAACGGAVVAAATGHHFDVGLVAIVVLAAAGLAVLVTSLVRGARRS
ncbi:MAG: hypothetical protein FWF02_05020 [Micrococcales bacterium]|nr:hypothetical protein [Micrococcales bacterium]MCL2667055.1 hypothetical protein [Micrococcales bacterium]